MARGAGRARSARRRSPCEAAGDRAAPLAAPGLDPDEAERRAFRARKRAERETTSYVASLSFRTVTYKALCAADQLAAFYADLRDPAFAVPFGIFHQRFSTNTAPSWERAQPFRLLCHNGEINAIQGNVNWMRAREGRLGSDDERCSRRSSTRAAPTRRCSTTPSSCSCSGGRDVRHALAMLVPEAWEGNARARPDASATSTATTRALEPWDGPAGLVFTDGTRRRRRARPQRAAAAALRVAETASSSAAPRPAAVDLPAGRGSAAGGSARAR